MATTEPAAPRLDARLLTAARLVRPGSPAADVGCDHGRLAAWLVCTGRCPRVVASDLRPAPLACARATCESFGCLDRVDCRLAAGLEGLAPGEVRDIVVAGLSAETTIGILEAAPWVFSPGVRLVLVPATRHELLRRWLAGHGFALVQDVPVESAGRWYAVMAADYTGQVWEPGELWCQLGRTGAHPGAAGYREDRFCRWRKRLRGLADEAERARQLALMEESKG